MQSLKNKTQLHISLKTEIYENKKYIYKKKIFIFIFNIAYEILLKSNIEYIFNF